MRVVCKNMNGMTDEVKRSEAKKKWKNGESGCFEEEGDGGV